jgi:hypothetical protein|tara:strand:+ start:2611 stop:2883 length:273 start_codon:yes stop_codon:yes gene_type:complete
MKQPRVILDDINDERPKFKVGDLVKAKSGNNYNPSIPPRTNWQIGLILEVDEYSNNDPGRRYFKWRYLVAWPDGSKAKYSAGALIGINCA